MTKIVANATAVQKFTYRRVYTGPVQALILDWAGTTVDYGSQAPVSAFVEVFRRWDLDVTPQQARKPMGAAKRDHVWALLAMEPVGEQWRVNNGREWTEDDVDAIYEDFVPLQVESATSHTDLIPGTVEAIDACRDRGIKIGSSSGYNRKIMKKVLAAARKQGYEPDSLVCPEDVPAGRPYPWAIYKGAMDLSIYPMSACVKVGDTMTDIEEGLNAGAWTVGLAKSGNELGLDEEAAEKADRRELDEIHQRMYRTGTHYVVDTIVDLPKVIDSVEARLARGEQP